MMRDVKDDLSLGTKTLFGLIMEARREEEPPGPTTTAPAVPPIVPVALDLRRVDQCVDQFVEIKRRGRSDTVVRILAGASNAMIRAIDEQCQRRYMGSLDSILKREFSGHMEKTLRLMVARAVNPVEADARALEDSMKGLGTKDTLLITRLVRCAWDRNYLAAVRTRYRGIFGRELEQRIRGETSGDYRRFLLALVTR